MAGRPPGSSPLVLARELGFRLLPCDPATSPEFRRSTTALLAYACKAGQLEHDARVYLALARGLLLRSGLRHRAADARALARLLGGPTPSA